MPIASRLKDYRSFWFLAALLLAPTPARAALYGGIEIGAKGIKSTVLEVNSAPEGLRVKILLAGTKNMTLVKGIATSGKFDAKDLQETAAIIRSTAEEMETKHKVPKENIYIVASSGIFTPIAKDAKAVAANRAELEKAIRKVADRSMDFITVAQEAQLSIKGIVPSKFLGTSVLLDIGSGNTKGGFQVKSGEYALFDVPLGSVTFSERVKKQFGDESIVRGSARLSREVARPGLAAAVKEHAGMRTRKRVYLSGGACWALATFTRPSDRSGYVALTAKDIAAYHKMLASNPGKYPTLDLSAIADPTARKATEKDLERVKKTFTPEQLLAGAELLQAFSDEFDLNSEKSVYFSRNGYLGWILAYAAKKSAKS
jgi:exopolyphosphatase/pppGpp-phosphohydrolase